MKKYWYKIDIEYCVLCGKEKVYKERQYTKKPKDWNKRVTFSEDACSIHFI